MFSFINNLKVDRPYRNRLQKKLNNWRKINYKIFVIGFSKTGTNSFNDLFVNNGINSNHGGRDVLDNIDRYDAFTDGSHLNFTSYYEARPDSLFILNVRPIKKWLISTYKQGKLRNWIERWCWPPSEEKTLEFIKKREQHFYNILEFFKDKHKQLLIVNIEREGWENFVLKYININNNIKVHSNERKDESIDKEKLDLIYANVSHCLKLMNYSGEELLLKNMSDYQEYNIYSQQVYL